MECFSLICITVYRDRFPELPGNSSELNTVVSHSTKGLQDESLLALRVDMSQCVECTRCVRVCREVVGLEVWKVDPTQPFPVVPTTGHLLADTSCVSCGQVIMFLVNFLTAAVFFSLSIRCYTRNI